jgi:hypothetical protein
VTAIDAGKASGASALNVLASPILFGGRASRMERVAAATMIVDLKKHRKSHRD